METIRNQLKQLIGKLEDTSNIFKLGLFFWLVGWFYHYKMYLFFFNTNVNAPYIEHPLLHSISLNPQTAKIAYLLPLVAIAPLFYKRVYWLTCCIMLIPIACSLFLLYHIETYNDATFNTSLWVSLWLLYYPTSHIVNSFDRAHWAFIGRLTISLIFLGGFVGKLTEGYYSGEVFSKLFLTGYTSSPLVYLRQIFNVEQLQTIGRIFSHIGIIVEGGAAFTILLSYRIHLFFASLAVISILILISSGIFSVISGITGTIIVIYTLNRVFPKDPDEKNIILYNNSDLSAVKWVKQLHKSSTHKETASKFLLQAVKPELLYERFQTKRSICYIDEEKIYTDNLALNKLLKATKKHKLLRGIILILPDFLVKIWLKILLKKQQEF